MAIANFEEFCAGFCEVARIDAPQLSPDPQDALSFTVTLNGVDIVLLQVRSRSDIAFAMIELGPMPNRYALDGWRALLETNHSLLGQDAPVFSRHPVTGEVILQRALPLDALSVTDVLERVQLLADLALQWPQQCVAVHEAASAAAAPDIATYGMLA